MANKDPALDVILLGEHTTARKDGSREPKDIAPHSAMI